MAGIGCTWRMEYGASAGLQRLFVSCQVNKIVVEDRLESLLKKAKKIILVKYCFWFDFVRALSFLTYQHSLKLQYYLQILFYLSMIMAFVLVIFPSPFFVWLWFSQSIYIIKGGIDSNPV